jgi:protein ImuA
MVDRTALLEQLARVCRSGHADGLLPAVQPSGFDALDALLPGGGWPVGALTELMPAAVGIGELQLLLPALRQLARAGRHIVWIAPPYPPYAPALAQHGIPLEQLWIVRTRDGRETLWAAEQALRCPSFGAVLAWPAQAGDKSIRRLQLAAEAGGNLAVLYRPAAAAAQPSPAALRLLLAAAENGITVQFHKLRGALGAHARVHCALPGAA